MDLGLQDVHVLVTGASGGIGIEVSRLFLMQGAKVTAHYNSNSKTLPPLITEFPNRAQALQADLSVEKDVVRLCAQAAENERFGPVQVVIINHGFSHPGGVPVLEMTVERWRETVDKNLTAAFLVAREYLRGLSNAPPSKREAAAIVLVGSTAGKLGEAGNADYAASKSGMMYGLLYSLKNEIVKIAPRGRVNCVAPGWVRTPMATKALEDGDTIYVALATTPLKKIAEPSDIAFQIVVLSSSVVSGHVSGQVLMVEGGMEGRLLNHREDVTY